RAPKNTRRRAKAANPHAHDRFKLLAPSGFCSQAIGAAVCGRWEQGGNAVLRTAWSLTLQVAMNCVFSCDDLLQT
ncbi:hypothetical protein, partial [Thermomonas sp.]|uniref:hypothetical protein n=1 Tax=Thermomonas sp. TaxID=1971895 RepID=UPI0035ADB85B